jgi:hypothetical protein
MYALKKIMVVCCGLATAIAAPAQQNKVIADLKQMNAHYGKQVLHTWRVDFNYYPTHASVAVEQNEKAIIKKYGAAQVTIMNGKENVVLPGLSVFIDQENKKMYLSKTSSAAGFGAIDSVINACSDVQKQTEGKLNRYSFNCFGEEGDFNRFDIFLRPSLDLYKLVFFYNEVKLEEELVEKPRLEIVFNEDETLTKTTPKTIFERAHYITEHPDGKITPSKKYAAYRLMDLRYK